MEKMEEQRFTILIQGMNGIGRYRDKHELKVPVYCTEKELETIANAMVSAYNDIYDFVCCVASKGRSVDNRDYDYMFADCM